MALKISTPRTRRAPSTPAPTPTPAPVKATVVHNHHGETPLSLLLLVTLIVFVAISTGLSIFNTFELSRVKHGLFGYASPMTKSGMVAEPKGQAAVAPKPGVAATYQMAYYTKSNNAIMTDASLPENPTAAMLAVYGKNDKPDSAHQILFRVEGSEVTGLKIINTKTGAKKEISLRTGTSLTKTMTGAACVPTTNVSYEAGTNSIRYTTYKVPATGTPSTCTVPPPARNAADVIVFDLDTVK